MKTATELDTGQRAFVRLNGPDRRLMARLDAITAQAKADMGARYDELAREWE